MAEPVELDLYYEFYDDEADIRLAFRDGRHVAFRKIKGDKELQRRIGEHLVGKKFTLTITTNGEVKVDHMKQYV